MDAFIEFCGGEEDSKGYLRQCQNKLAAWDEATKTMFKSKDTMTKSTKISTSIVNTKACLAAAPVNMVKSETIQLTPVDNSKATKNSKDKMYDELQKYYGFTDEEMAYLKENYPNLLNTLYNAQTSSTNLEMRTYEKIKEELKYMDLTSEQAQYVKNLNNLCKKEGYSAQKVSDMQIIAKNLFCNGYSVSFVAGMLGNVYIEGDFGYLEGVNPGTNTEYNYWNRMNSYSYKDNKTGHVYKYYDDFSFGHIYDVDYKAYRQLVNNILLDPETGEKTNIIGCGSCQWTIKSRYELLMKCYEEADREGDNDGQISYEECVIGETTCMLEELSSEGDFHYVVEECSDNNSANAAIYNAEKICNDYENPSDKDKKLEQRKKAAEEIYNVMMQ